MFKEALNGLRCALNIENNLRFDVLSAVTILIFSFAFSISSSEWAEILIVISMVLCAEMFNTSIELLCNKIEPKYDEDIRRIKDISAGSVLVSVAVSVIVGTLVFVPHIMVLQFLSGGT